IPVTGGATQATLRLPDGSTRIVPVHEGRAVTSGDKAGFYELEVAAATSADPAQKTPFAANLTDEAESAILPQPKLDVHGKPAGALEAFHVGVRREIWIYLLLAAVLLTALEWATYHRRVTV